jgi:parallel beta-helix repeat protein
MKKIIQISILTAIIGLFVINDISAQTLMGIPAPTASYSGNTRGYWFLAPCNFIIVGLKVPTNYSSANSYITVVDFGTTQPPTFSTTTNAFTTLVYLQNIAGTTMIPVNLPVISGHYIGIMGCRGSISNYAVAGPYATTINGLATSLYRLGMQYDLTSTAPKDLWYEASTIAVVEMYYSIANYKADAGITAINAPVSPVAPGSTNVTATLKNFGNDTLKTVGLRWSVNGIQQTSPSNWTGALAKNATTGPLTFGSYNFTPGMHSIKTWTVNPNGITDSNKMNDTATISIMSCNPAGGTYVIDPTGSGNFKTFNQALDWLKSCGVAGPVTFRVKPGTYTEQVTIPAITGASSTNRITFESYDLDSTKVNLTYAATATTDNWVLRFNGCSYVTFRKMSITATGATYGTVVEYITAATYDVLESNILKTLVTTSSSYSVVYSSSTLDHYNTVKNNVIIGGYYGIYWYGASTTSFELGSVIEGNTIKDFYYAGLYVYYQDAIKIRKNTIISSTSSSTVYGIFTYYCNNSIEITQNNIQLTATGAVYPLTLSSDAGTTALRGSVSNNFVSTMGSTGTTIYGIYVSSSSYHDVNYNSVCLSNNFTSSRAFFITAGTASTVNVLNNNFINLGGGYAIYTGSASTSLNTCNYNNIFSTSTNLCYWTANAATLAAWRSASAKDANSVNLNPNYVSSTDLHVNSAGISGMGTPIAGITVDIDGETRLNPPDIGADEFNLVANDAGVSLMATPIPPCPGINSVSVKVRNYGSAVLTSVTVSWSVNGLAQTPLSISTLTLSQGQETTLNLGNYTFNIGLSYNMKFWTSQPNGATDGNARNDTFLYKNLATSFGGTYTIGGASASYPTINAAVADMQARGICGPTTFKINKGIYSGRIVIPPIIGASSVNRITFDGKNADSVKITYAGTSTALATVLFNGADYITFKNVTIENTATSTAYAICFTGQADYNTIDSCKLLVDPTGSVSTVIVAVSTATETSYSGVGNNSNYTTISNCLIKGGYYGVTFYGTSYTVNCTNNSIINCTFDKQYYYGIYSYYQTYQTFRNNYMAGFRYSSAYGIMNYYSGSTPNISYNTITGVSYGIYNYGYSSGPCTNPQIIGNTVRALVYGLYQYYNTSSNIERNDFYGGYSAMYVAYETNPVDSSLIINNFAHQGGGTYTYGHGLYLASSAKVSIYHNTFQTDTTYTTPTSYGTVRVVSSTGAIKIKNNIFKTFGNLPCFNTDGAGIAAGDLDYNIYYTFIPGNIIAYWGSTTYTSFTVWKSSMTTFNQNSMYGDPQLVSKYNLHLKPGSTFNRGIPLGIDRDVDNDYRCLPMPTIGADEYIHPYDKPNADFLSDTSACISSPYTFLNKAGLSEAKRHFWYVNSVFKSNAVNFTYNFQTQGANAVTLITQNCSTTDTVTKTINVGLASRVPESYFVVNKNKVEVNEQVSLSDLSSYCPEHWKWNILPDSIFDPLVGKNVCTYTMSPGADTTQSPQISFKYSGIYSVCLSTGNSIGTGTKYCLNQYIEVLPAVKLCYSPFETKEYSGSLYDDGGSIAQYSANKSCSFLIHPCTKMVSLVFSTFDIVQGDYIRIYDGRDNKSTPMWNPTLYPDGINNIFFPPSTTDTFKARSGSMYIEIVTDGSSQGNGIVAKWFSTPEAYAPTKASFDVPDTICNGVATTIYNTSTGVQNDNFWDYENDGITDASTLHGLKSYMPDGNYTLKLTVNGCGGVDSFLKNIYVKTITGTPKFQILSSNIKPNAFYDVVTVSQNTLKNCIDSTIWDITPKSYTLVSGKLNYSSAISLKFNDTVCYDFTVIGKYHGYSDTEHYSCFIHPVNYCKPFMGYLSPDVGISRVRLNTIDKSSDIGVSAYSDFSGSVSTDLERGASYDITINRNTTSNPMNRKVWIDYNHDGTFDNTTELVAYEPSAFTLVWTATISLQKNLRLGVVRMRVGATLGNSPNTPCGPGSYGEYEDYNLNIIPDKTRPMMSLIGPAVIHLEECSGGYNDPGVLVTDNADTSLGDSVKVTGIVNTYLSGTYILTYNVKDNTGNVAVPINRTVIVDKEKISPEIKLIGNPVQIVQLFNSYSDSGYVAYDTCSGLDKVITTTNLDTANIGMYYYNYRAFDKNGNDTDISRTIYVMDTIDPVITSISDDTILLNIYNILPKPLYTVTDNYYPYYKINITIKGSYYQVFPNGEATIPGFYTFMYVATDGSGNSDSISFVVNVLDKVKPVLQLHGDISYTICRFDTLVDPGYTVTDNYDPNPKVVKTGTYITKYLPLMVIGNYELVYTATDNSGNRVVDSRFITVSDQGSCHNSINEKEESDGIRLYPNPGDGDFTVLFNYKKEQLVTISIINSIGKVVYQIMEPIKPGQIKTFTHQDWETGIYFIQVTQNGKTSSIKYNLVK